MNSCLRHKRKVCYFLFLLIVCVLYWKIVIVHERNIFNPGRRPVGLQEAESEESYQMGNTDDDDLNSWDLKIKNRVARVKGLCKQYHLGIYSWENRTNDLHVKDPPTPQYSYFFHNREHKFAWCPVYKSGSTTWLYNMMLLAGYSEDQLKNPSKQLSILAREVYMDMDPSELNENVLKLLVVRHPFERIMSAYRDKLSNASVGLEHGTAHFYEKYGRKIVKNFRTDPTITQKEPTFEEFVRYLIKTNLILYSDDHWLPAYYSCTPCRVDYDVIAKTETYMMDQKYVIAKASLDSNGGVKPRWEHPTRNVNSLATANSNDLARKYFGELNRSQIQLLYEKYFLDFKLFNYSHLKYLIYGKIDN